MMRFIRAHLMLLLLAQLLSGCSGQNHAGAGDLASPPTPPPAVNVSAVPELRDHVLTIGSDVTDPPTEFFAPGSNLPQGLDIDLAEALAHAMGVRLKIANIPFADLITVLEESRIDVIMSAMSVTPSRSALFYQIPYLKVGTGIAVAAGNPRHVQSLQDLCGLRVGVQSNTVQVDQVTALSCASQPQVVTLPLLSQALAGLEGGSLDALLMDFPSAQYQAANSGGTVQVVAAQFDVLPYGIGVRHTSYKLGLALVEALNVIISDGTYEAILQKWNLQQDSL